MKIKILLLVSILTGIAFNFVNTQQQETNPSLDGDWLNFKNQYKKTYSSVAEEFSRYFNI